MAVGIDEAETREGVVEQRAHMGLLASLERRAGEVLAPAARFERSARLVDLLGGDGLVVEVDPGAAAAIGPRTVVQDAGAGLDDEPEDLPGEIVQVGGVQMQRGHRSLEEAEGALHVGFVLWAPLGSADTEGDIAERGIDVGGVVRWLVVEEERERGLTGGGNAFGERFGRPRLAEAADGDRSYHSEYEEKIAAAGKNVAASVSAYEALLHLPVGLPIPALSLPHSLLHWINDGLMSVFFFLVGLEIKREVLAGELSSARQIALPGLAALGGMAAPALIYLLVNRDLPANLAGWAIPAATDIAFAVDRKSVV